MATKNGLIQLIQDQGVLPLYFHKDPEVSIAVLKTLHSAGIKAIEYTNRGKGALENFKALREVCDKELDGMSLGVGPIKNKTAAVDFIAAGADFIVCPGLVDEVAQEADAKDMLWIPGCMTPSEIIKAESKGAKMIKLFPGSLLGPSFLQSIKSLFPDLLFMPTGGVDVTEENLRAWFQAGVCAVGMGSKLIRKDFLEQKAYEDIKNLTIKTIHYIHSIR